MSQIVPVLCQSLKSDTLSLKTVINVLDFLRKKILQKKKKKKKKSLTKINQQPKSFENSNIADKKISYYRASKKFT